MTKIKSDYESDTPYRETLADNNVPMPHGSARRLQKAMEQGRITREDLLVNAGRVLEFLLKLE